MPAAGYGAEGPGVPVLTARPDVGNPQDLVAQQIRSRAQAAGVRPGDGPPAGPASEGLAPPSPAAGPDWPALLASLSVEALERRLHELDGERAALVVFLAAARKKGRPRRVRRRRKAADEAPPEAAVP